MIPYDLIKARIKQWKEGDIDTTVFDDWCRSAGVPMDVVVDILGDILMEGAFGITGDALMAQIIKCSRCNEPMYQYHVGEYTESAHWTHNNPQLNSDHAPTFVETLDPTQLDAIDLAEVSDGLDDPNGSLDNFIDRTRAGLVFYVSALGEAHEAGYLEFHSLQRIGRQHCDCPTCTYRREMPLDA